MNDMEKAMASYNPMEIAKIAGEPRQPDVRMPYFIEAISEFDTALPNDYYYSFDTISDTQVIYVVTADGGITQSQVSPDTPALVSFVDIQTPEYYAKLIDLCSAKESVIARKQQTISRAMDAYECYLVRTLLDTSAVAQSNTFTLTSGTTKFNYPNLIDMLEAVEDYGTSFKLIAGSQVAKDIRKFDYDENKYQSVKTAFEDLNIEMIRVGLKSAARTFNLDADNSGGTSSTDVIPAANAYLVASDTVMGNPILFVRKEVNQVEQFGVMTNVEGDRPYRFTFVSPNPVTVTTGPKRYLGVGFTGFGEIAAVTRCPEAIARFVRE